MTLKFLRQTTAAVALLSLTAAPTRGAAPSPLVFAVVVGNNDGLGMLPSLRYADDDALRFYRLAVRLAPKHNVALLTELDVDTWRRIQLSGDRPPPFLPPTRDKLLEVIRLFKQQIARARRADPGRQVHLYFFFSGHGEKGYFFLKRRQGPLARSAFTGTDLDRTFGDSQATLNALFIDACKSQSLFLAKGGPGGKQDDELGPDFSGLIKKLERTSSRTPIGVLTSTVSDRPAGEARDIRGGYFSHVLISGLRGAADANSDGVIRYGELAAFVSFHTRRIAGQRPWFRPPDGRLDTPLITLTERHDLLELPPGLAGHLAVFDAKGRNLVLEVHKTQAQWTRLILSPGRYKVVWITSPSRGLSADVDLTQGSQRLMLANFDRMVVLGQDYVPKGEGLGAPPDLDEPEVDPSAIDFDPSRSGFDQPFTPRVVSAMVSAYDSGRTARPEVKAQAPAPSGPRHFISAGYGMHSPPLDELTAGQGLDVGYFYRLQRLPLYLGLRGFYAFSSHLHVKTDQPFHLRRLMLQAEGRYGLPFGGRFEVSLGAYVGWQATMITSKDGASTVLSGDAAGFRAGLTAELRASITGGLWASINAAWGIDVAHQLDERTEQVTSEAFMRPQAYGQVGYAF